LRRIAEFVLSNERSVRAIRVSKYSRHERTRLRARGGLQKFGHSLHGDLRGRDGLPGGSQAPEQRGEIPCCCGCRAGPSRVAGVEGYWQRKTV
jgi:hypothetical protein